MSRLMASSLAASSWTALAPVCCCCGADPKGAVAVVPNELYCGCAVAAGCSALRGATWAPAPIVAEIAPKEPEAGREWTAEPGRDAADAVAVAFPLSVPAVRAIAAVLGLFAARSCSDSAALAPELVHADCAAAYSDTGDASATAADGTRSGDAVCGRISGDGAPLALLLLPPSEERAPDCVCS